MQPLIKKTIKRLFKPLFARVAQENSIAEADLDSLNNFYSILKKINFQPNHVVDVGANHGNWTRTALKYFPNAYYTLLEPQKWLESSIKDLLDSNHKITFNPIGAGSSAGSFKFTLVSRDDSSSFRFSDEDAKKHGFSQIDVPVVTLNEFIGQLNLPIPDIIKIDAEGLDLEVLQGASDFFCKTEVFMVEAGVGSKDIQNSFIRVINFMDENGYRLFEITDLNRPFEPKILWLVELAFVRKDGFIDSKKIVS